MRAFSHGQHRHQHRTVIGQEDTLDGPGRIIDNPLSPAAATI